MHSVMPLWELVRFIPDEFTCAPETALLMVTEISPHTGVVLVWSESTTLSLPVARKLCIGNHSTHYGKFV